MKAIGSTSRRALQHRTPRKDGFGPRKQKRFLEHLAATCNVISSAKAAGINPKTCYAARNRDPAFAAAWGTALQHGYDRIEAALVARALEAIEPVAFDPDAVSVELEDGGGITAEGIVGDTGVGAGRPAAAAPAPKRKAPPRAGSGLSGRIALPEVQVGLALLNHRQAMLGKGGARRGGRRATASELEEQITAKLDSLARRLGRAL